MGRAARRTLRPLPPGTNRSAPNYESGGQELESLRARHEINDLAHHDLPEKAPG